jgi:hypothetical protein
MAVGDWDLRQLCPDGACVGVIGADGLCKVCGRAAQGWGDERKRGLVADGADTSDALDEDEDDDDDDDDDDDLDEDDELGDDDEGDYEEDEIDPISPSAPAALGALAEWAERRLCSDGSCIGLIGDDGRCKVCGMVGSAPKVGSAAKGRAVVAMVQPAADDDALEEAARDLAASASPEAVSALVPAPEIEDAGNRKLCPDGGCVGVIGSDGRCKVCGKETAA